jgi:hypothetical protein
LGGRVYYTGIAEAFTHYTFRVAIVFVQEYNREKERGRERKHDEL